MLQPNKYKFLTVTFRIRTRENNLRCGCLGFLSIINFAFQVFSSYHINKRTQ